MLRSRLLVALLVIATALAPLLARRDSGVAALEATPITVPLAGVDLTGVSPLPLEGERRAAFEAFIANALALCGAPGAAVAVVQNGSVVFIEGFGVRERGRPRPVTPDTLMRVGSVTKSFTTTLAATLVDAGRVSWETPAIDLLPDFALSDPDLSARLTLADLFSAASGLPRRDLEFIFEADAYTPEGMLAVVAELPVTAPPGVRYQYSNQAFTVGGYALAAADGAAPDDLWRGYTLGLKDRVLNPTGMERSTFDLSEVLRSGDYASPHASGLSGLAAPIPLQVEERFSRAVGPAGALWSTARDISRYLQMQLAHGVAADGTRVVSAENLERTWRPGVAVPPSPDLPPLVSAGLERYGLGWYVGQFGGREMISHSGGTYGFGSQVAFLPDAALGIAVLVNDVRCGALIGFAAQYRLLELLFDQEPVVEAILAEILAEVRSRQAAAAGMLRPFDAEAMAPFAGRFTNPALGEVEFRLQGEELLFDAGEVGSRLKPLPALPGLPPQFTIIDPPLYGAPAFFTFTTEDGVPRPALILLGEYGDAPLVYVFTRVMGDG